MLNEVKLLIACGGPEIRSLIGDFVRLVFSPLPIMVKLLFFPNGG